MDIKAMTLDQIEERKSAIVEELEADGADLNALEAEMKGLNAELEERAATESKKAEIRAAVAAGAGEIVKKVEREERTDMKTNEQVRASQEYLDAFAKFIVTENDAECRSLLTENVSGSVPVPSIVDDIIRTAWDNDEVVSRVRKTYVRGNLKVPFEKSATGAYAHTEGTTAPTEESLELGVVTLIAKNIKKYIYVSDEAIAQGGETLVRYIYDEITYQIIKAIAALVVNDIKTAPTSATGSAASVAAVTAAPAVTTIAKAYANLSDQAVNPVVIMNKLTYANFVAAQAAGNFAFDPFNNLPVVYNNSLPAYDSASANAVYAIVGDLSGAQINYPEGDGVVLKYDDMSKAEEDLVKILGRQYAAHGVTACGMFCNIKKPSGATT